MSNEPIEVKTQRDIEDEGLWSMGVAIAIILILGAIGWKLTGKSDIGMYAGAIIGAVICWFNENLKDALLTVVIGLGALYGLIVLFVWIFVMK
jgi:hypothetical protein